MTFWRKWLSTKLPPITLPPKPATLIAAEADAEAAQAAGREAHDRVAALRRRAAFGSAGDDEVAEAEAIAEAARGPVEAASKRLAAARAAAGAEATAALAPALTALRAEAFRLAGEIEALLAPLAGIDRSAREDGYAVAGLASLAAVVQSARELARKVGAVNV